MAARRTVSRGSLDSAMRARAVSGSRSRPSVSAARTLTCASGLASACRSRGTTRSGGHAREGAHRALLDELALVPEQLEEQHGRVLVAQASDGRRRLRAHFLRGVVDERRRQVDPARGRDPGDAAHDALADGVAGMLEPALVGLAVAGSRSRRGRGPRTPAATARPGTRSAPAPPAAP